jgi:lipoate-protein ligase B
MQFKVFDLGLVDFKKAWDFQKEVFFQVKNDRFKSALILCQHYPVITLGRSATRKNILAQEAELKNKGIKVYEVERGGDVTYHGPGQLTAYPIFNLNYLKKDIHWFLRYLENIIIGCLSDLGTRAHRLPGLTGVWVNKRKIASIGIAIKNWITFHGLSINIKKADLVNFNLIKPCGMDIMVTSLESVLGSEIRVNQLKKILTRRLKNDQSTST